jgi:hypothetical protein
VVQRIKNMFQLTVQRQNEYSRLKLIARLFFGLFYIIIPHFLMLIFVGVGAKLLWLYATFYILLKGEYPKKTWKYQLGVLNWISRLHLSAYNLRDDYPLFGINKEVSYLSIQIEKNETPDRLWVLVRFVLAPVIMIPHLVVWTFRNFWSIILTIGAFFNVLYKGQYPESLFEFNIGTLRWILRILAYQLHLTEDYPPFTGK